MKLNILFNGKVVTVAVGDMVGGGAICECYELILILHELLFIEYSPINKRLLSVMRKRMGFKPKVALTGKEAEQSKSIKWVD